MEAMPAQASIRHPSHAKLLSELGERLRLARLRRKFTVSLVAQRAEISRPTLNKVEKGDPSVTLGTYLQVLTVLGLETDLGKLAGEDVLGRALQDAELRQPRKPSNSRGARGDQAA